MSNELFKKNCDMCGNDVSFLIEAWSSVCSWQNGPKLKEYWCPPCLRTKMVEKEKV